MRIRREGPTRPPGGSGGPGGDGASGTLWRIGRPTVLLPRLALAAPLIRPRRTQTDSAMLYERAPQPETLRGAQTLCKGVVHPRGGFQVSSRQVVRRPPSGGGAWRLWKTK